MHSQTQHVASGSFAVSKSKNITYQAFLGTCVGVAIYDAHAGVGGLIHILLPSPVSPNSTFQSEKYASTGLPVFIEALINEGASVENMKAVIAGGALVGPLNEYDVALDIGGKTAETAQNILRTEKIEIEKSETGGFFTSCLNLDMNDFSTSIKPTVPEKSTEGFSFAKPGDGDIKKTMEELKPIPQVALKIMRLINEDSYSIADVADEVKKDQVISAKTIHLCNSAVFSGRPAVSTIEDSLLLLGQDTLVKSVISVAVKNFFNQSSTGYSLCKGGLYHHAIGTAVIAEQIAEMTQTASPAVAYTAGLLHDIGMVVLDQYITRACPLFYRGMRSEKSNILSVEKTILGINHCEAGHRLANVWNFTEPIAEVVAYHHTPDQIENDNHLVQIVYISDLLMSRFNSGLELEHSCNRSLDLSLDRLGLAVSDVEKIVDTIPVEIFSSTPESAIK